jgi:putative SOS response-associated peptidase YedK
MCGRYAIFGPASRKNREALEFLERELDFTPTWNAAPTRELPVFRVDARRGRELTLLRWGLVPFWAKTAAIGAKLINARGDTLAVKPAFREAFGRRHCLVPMCGFYEWRKAGAARIPYFVRPLNTDVFAVAGLYEFWPGRDGAAPIGSFTIITTEANDLVRPLHDRMPAILHESDYDTWLAPQDRDPAALQALLAPHPADEMRAYPVGPRVNSARNDGPDLVEEAGEPRGTLI